MKSVDGKTFSAYVRSKLHSGYITIQLCMDYQLKSNVHLLYSFIHVFIHNSITKCFWQKFCQTFGKGV